MSRIKSSQDIIKSMVVENDSDENIERDFLMRNNANNIASIKLIDKNITEFEHAKYLFENIIPEKAKDLYDEGVIYIHDKTLMNYCVSLDCKQVALEGVPTIAKNMLASKPTKSFFKFMRHLSNVCVYITNQCSGALMFANFSTIVASYLKYNEEHGIKHEITEQELDREIGSLIWELNSPLRNGAETSFSNITMEFEKCSPVIANDFIIIGGEAKEEKYSELESKYIDMVNHAVIKFMGKGPGVGKIFTFPLITVQVGDDFNKNNETYKFLIEESKKFGGFYAENFRTHPYYNSDFKDVNPMIKPKDPTVSRSLCCVKDDTKMVVFDKNNVEYYMTIKELYDKYGKDDYTLSCDFFIDSLNPKTFEVERVALSGIMKKRNDSRLFTIRTSSMKTICVTGDHMLIVKDIVEDKVLEISCDSLMNLLSTSNSNRYMIPIM